MPKKKVDKFYNFSFNEAKNETDLYIYGEIISGGNDWKWDESDVTFQDVRDTLNAMDDNSTLNMYINSPGGSVFTTSSMLSMLERAKTRGITINSYIDGLGASCASFLPFVADNMYIYKNSVLMIHRASTMCWGNADDMQQQIDLLNKIENDIIIPMYMSRAKDGVTEQDFRDYMANESWFTSNEIMDIFDNITLLESEKQVSACVDKNMMDKFTNMPDNIKDLLKVKEDDELENQDKKDIKDDIKDSEDSKEEENKDTQEGTSENEDQSNENNNNDGDSTDSDDASDKGQTDLKAKLDESNEKVIALSEKLQEVTEKLNTLQPLVDKYTSEKEEADKLEREAKIQETSDLYKNKFEKIGALDKFESEEVQNLIKNSLDDKDALSNLNSMLVDLISIENITSKKKTISEEGKEVKDLIPNESGLSSYFE